MSNTCIIALDLGTTAFKCAPVNEDGLLAEPTNVSYNLDYDAGAVTFEPQEYIQVAAEALTGAIKSAKAAGLTIDAIGISSQAQTYIPLDTDGQPLQKAIVWTDGRAVDEAREVAEAIPDFACHSGFRAPLPAQFMPKVRHFARHSGIPISRVWKFPLLNEYIIYRLTGSVYGDTTNQGMSGFYHIAERCWSQTALDLAGITAQQLADTAPAAEIGRALSGEWCDRLGIDPAPVYSCGNDQSSAATGAGLHGQGDILCNFGTAMVVYALKDELPLTLLDKQIAGISPLTGRYFLLGVESECGNVLDWAHRLCYAEHDFTTMLQEALALPSDVRGLPVVALPGGGRIDLQELTIGCDRRHLVRSLLELYAETCDELLRGVMGQAQSCTFYAAGGLSRSDLWLGFLSRKLGVRFTRPATEHAGLVGIARIIRRAHPD
jgi:sugar (pentulose or hexulose) kinase